MHRQVSRTAVLRLILIGVTFLCVLALSFALAEYILENESARQVVESFGYLGVAFLSMLSGLNPFLPVPAATFTPVFEAAGLTLPLIVLALVAGVMVADTIGYLFGHWSRDSIATKYPTLYDRFHRLAQKRKRVIFPFVFVYAAFMPLPNELILIPLAVAGLPFRVMLLPLITGNIIHQVALAYGISSLFVWVV